MKNSYTICVYEFDPYYFLIFHTPLIQNQPKGTFLFPFFSTVSYSPTSFTLCFLLPAASSHEFFLPSRNETPGLKLTIFQFIPEVWLNNMQWQVVLPSYRLKCIAPWLQECDYHSCQTNNLTSELSLGEWKVQIRIMASTCLPHILVNLNEKQ